MTPRRIGIFTPTFLPKCAGAEIFHHNLAAQLAAAGHHPVVIAPRRNARELRESGWNLPYAVEGYAANLWSYLKRSAALGLWLNRRALSRLQRRHSFDVWHSVVLFPAGACFADWQARSGVPGLVRAVGDDVRGLPGNGHAAWVDAIVRGSIPKAQAVVALSDSMVGDLTALGVDRGRIHLMPNAVDCDRFAVGIDRAAVRAARGIPADAFVFLCVARNHPQKDFPTLLRAFRLLRDRPGASNARLIIAGRGAPGLADEVSAAGVGGSVQLLEFAAPATGSGVPVMPPQELVDLYRAADAFVLSSVLEGFSSALIEAMAASLPVVATDAPGIHEIVRPGDNGLLVPCRDPGELSQAMARVLEDRNLAGALSSAGRQTAGQYSWPAVTRAYVQLYEDLIAGR